MFEIESSQQFKVFFFSKDQLDLFCGELRVAKTFFLEMDKYNELKKNSVTWVCFLKNLVVIKVVIKVKKLSHALSPKAFLCS